jgi:hypothetical protein
MKAAIDNDVLLKGACYGLLADLVSLTCPSDEDVGVLGSARYVVPGQIAKRALNRDRAVALDVFFKFLDKATALEPLDSEQDMAADLELTAQQLGVSLDAGESQLCAILVHRSLPLLLTGDKRAIAALERLLDVYTPLTPICGKVVCLEQLFAFALAKEGGDRWRHAVCAEPGVDKSLAICFSCHGESVSVESNIAGLRSYINDLRSVATRVLVS